MLDDKLDLFDALLTVAENIKLLVLGPWLLNSVLICQGYSKILVQRDVAAKLARIRLSFGCRRPSA
jgi:hypothetical protein